MAMIKVKQFLMKLAEPGVYDRLRAMQTELNELHRLFPHIVANADGTIPSVMPIERKYGSDSHGPGAMHAAGKAAGMPKATQKGKAKGKRRSPSTGQAKVAGSGARTRVPMAMANFLAMVPSGRATCSELAKVAGVTESRVQQIIYSSAYRPMFTKVGRNAVKPAAFDWTLTSEGHKMIGSNGYSAAASQQQQ
jgi:hypothetical protein